MSNETSPGAWYALRRTLVKWRFDESLADLLDFCESSRVDEVIVKCDTEEFSHGIPSVEWLADYQPMLVKARDALNAAGVVYSLNPWVTLVHGDRGWDLAANGRKASAVEMLTFDGQWVAAQGADVSEKDGRVVLTCHQPVDYTGPLLLDLTWQ